MDRKKGMPPKKSPSDAVGRTGSSAPEYGMNVPCFPSPLFPSHSHLRHVLPQIPTRAGHPRMAVSKASMRDPFLGRMFESESFADVITTHKLDDNPEPTFAAAKEACDEPKLRDRSKPESQKSAFGGGAKLQFSDEHVTTFLEGSAKGRKRSVWDENEDHSPSSYPHSVSPSQMLNIDESAKRRSSTVTRSSEFVKLGQKQAKDFSAIVADLDAGYPMNSKPPGPTRTSAVRDPLLSHRSTKSENSSLFPLFDEEDSDENNDSPVAMNLSLPTKSTLRSSAELLPKPSTSKQRPPVSSSADNFGDSPLDAIMQMTSMIHTSQKQPQPFVPHADPAGHYPLSQLSAPFCGDAWPHDTRIFGSGGSSAVSYGKIAAEGMLKLPAPMPVSSTFGSEQTRGRTEFGTSLSSASFVYETLDEPLFSSAQQSMKRTSPDKSSEGSVDSVSKPVSGGSPIELKICRSAGSGSSQLSVIASKQTRDVKPERAARETSPEICRPSPLALSLLGATPSPGLSAKLPAPSRAKTKGELKKQLFERKEQRLRTDSSQASSPAGSTMTPSPSYSHADTLSPLTVNVDTASVSTPQPSPQLSSGKTAASAVVSPAENVSVARSVLLYFCKNHLLLFIYCCKVVFGMVAINFSPFSEFSQVSQRRSHSYQLFKSHCHSSTRCRFFANRVVSVWNFLPQV